MPLTPLYTSVEKTIELKIGSVVFESHAGFPVDKSNIYLVSSEGEILWEAEKPAQNVLFTKMRLNDDGTISTFTNGGQFCDLDSETGKIISESSFR
ncbi:MAG: hypothetical protein LC099_10605 [Anaerolineales bacterium]|nr:hypothetical protein [Anaerolineales bacterium]